MPPAMLASLIDIYDDNGAWLWLVEITIPGYEIIRLARNPVDVSYGGTLYTASNLDVGVPSLTSDGSTSRAALRVFKDSDRTLETKINATKGACKGSVKIIRAHEDFLEAAITELEQTINILTAGGNEKWNTFLLGLSNWKLRKIPNQRFSSKKCPWAKPGLFKGPECQYGGADATCTGLYSDCDDKGNAVNWGGHLCLDPSAA